MPPKNKPSADDDSVETLAALCQVELPYVTTAFEKLVRLFEAQVYQTCERYLRSPAEAEEATQDVFMRVFHNIKKFKGASSFKTWLFRIVANTCATRYRSLRRMREQHEAYVEAAKLSAPEGESFSDRDLEGGPITEALYALAPSDREILILRHFSELSLNEIAEALRLSLSAAKMRLYRAERRLKTAVGGSIYQE